MDDEKTMDQNMENSSEEKKGLVVWVKEHKVQLIFAGISITTLFATIFGLKNKDAITELWSSLKEEIEKGSRYTGKWFEKSSLKELQDARDIVQQDYLNPKLDMDYRGKCWDLLAKFDNAIGKKQWAGKEYGYPVHSENGWHLPSKD